MKIDPKKIDFDKMKSDENLKCDANDNQAGNIDGIDSDDKYNIAHSFTPPANQAPIPAVNQSAASLKSPTGLLSEAWRLYKERWKTFAGIVVVPIIVVPIIVFAFLGAGAFGVRFLISFISEFFTSNNIIIYFINFIFLLSLFFAIIIIQFWSQVALIYAIKDSAENIGIKESYRRGWRKIKPLIWVSILSELIVISGCMLFIVPGIIFAVWFSFAVFIVVTEDLKGMNAILKSREYVRNYWWSVFWRFLFLVLFMCFIVIVVGFFITIFGGIMLGLGVMPDLDSNSLVAIINLSIKIISLVLTPLVVIYLFLIYNNLKEIKGDFEFSSSAKPKKSFIAIYVLGILLMIVMVGFTFSRSEDVVRHSDLSRIKIDLLLYYDDKNEYPESLSELGLNNYVDPETKDPYEYRRLNNGKDYEICIKFKKEGKKCFSSEVNVDEINVDKTNINETSKNKANSGLDLHIADNDLALMKRDEQRLSDLDSISYMLLKYKQKNGNYPVSPSVAKLNEDNDVVREIKSANNGKNIMVDPKDPEYYYGYKSDGKTYELSAVLENKDDSRCAIEGSFCIYRLKYLKETESKNNNNMNQKLVHESVKKDGISYEIYLPESYSENQSHSLFICLSPSGNGAQFYKTVYPAVNEFNWIMACSNDFKNNIPIDDFLPKITKMVDDVKSRFKIDNVYVGGFSGGGMGSYIVSYFNQSFSGLIINSGAIHQNLYNEDEIRKIKAKKIVLICGKKDSIVPCSYMKNDEAFLKAAGFETLLIEFDGGHTIAPQETYRTAIEWLNKK